MRTEFKALVVAALALPAVGIAATGMAAAGTVPDVGAQGCPDTRVFAVGGNSDENADAYNGFAGALPPGVDLHKVNYSADIWPIGELQMDASNAEGAQQLTDAVFDFHAHCGGSHITISGYSQGAIVAGDVLEMLSANPAIPHHQIDGVLYSDSRTPRYNGAPGGIQTTIPTILPGATMKGPREYGDIPVHRLCNVNDGICHMANPITNLIEFANDVQGYLQQHGYDIDPIRDRGNGNTIIPAPPLIPYGPPLPFPAPTPYELFAGLPLPKTQAELQPFLNQIRHLLPPELRDRLDTFGAPILPN